MNSESALVLLPKYLAFSPTYVILRMDPGNLINIVVIAHLLPVSLLFKSFPLHFGYSLISSTCPM